MNIKDNIINYLYDKNSLICIYDDVVYIRNYLSLDYINKSEVEVLFEEYKIYIYGNSFQISKMTEQEIQIKGNIKRIEKV